MHNLFSQESDIRCLEVDLDPEGPEVEEVLDELLQMAGKCPLIVRPWTLTQKQEIEEHIAEFEGSLALISAIDFYKGLK